MANEFKIKKGLIVTGASGGTVVDIQGSQGQLFSVTDDLSGTIFAVSDISGVPILDVNSSGLSTFDGNVNLPDSKKILLGTGNDFKLYHDGTHGVLNNTTGNLYTSALGSMMFRTSLNVTALTLDASQNATFAGNINLPTAKYLRFTSAASGSSGTVLFGNTTGTAGDLTFKRNSDSANMFKITGSGNAEVTGKGTSAATISSDGSSTLTTKGYVDSLITGATIYRGAWDPSGGGYGSPDLSTVTQTSGYYYICSAAGTAEPNGTGCEPDSWETGDWVIWNDDIVDCAGTGTGGWQKIDNSSVLSGVGTGQTVALWEGAGSVTDSETLGNAPITVDGNNTTFTGNGAVIATGLFRGDTLNNQANTHNIIYRSGTTTFIAGGDKLVVEDGGHVGVGIADPISKFQVVDTAFPQVRINEENNAGESGIRLRSTDGTADYHADIVANSTGGAAGYLAFRSNHSNERMRINSTGAIQFNAYGAGTLVSDASGNITVSSGGGTGGPYLPLSAGISFPLTGVLKISENSLIMSGRQTGVVSSSLPRIIQAVLESSIETNNAVVHPYFNNDLGNFVARGGNVIVGGVTTQPGSTAKNYMFQPSNQFMGVSGAIISGSTWSITILSDSSGDAAFNLNYGCHIGITFGSSSFDPTSMLIETTTDPTGATGWSTALNSSAASSSYVTFASSSGTGIKAIRFTMGYTSGDPRVNSIFAYNYSSYGMRNFFLGKDGGKVYGDIETTAFGSSVAINKITNSGNSYFNGGKVGIALTTPVETLTVPSTKGVMFGHKRFYSNTGTVPAGVGPTYFFSATLNEQQGATLTSQYQYKFYLTTTGTGTHNSSVYIVYRNSADTAWDSHRVSSTGLSSNHPELVISGNNANIYNDHPSAYGTAYRVETSYSQQAKTSPQIFGSDYMWTRDNTDLYYMDGDVGIGVSSPAFKLDVAGAIQTTGSLRITTANPGVIFKETDITDKNWDIQVNNGNLKFYEVNDARSVFNEHVTFGTGGNVGIGFTSPQAAPLATTKLSVNGNTYVGGTLGVGTTDPATVVDITKVTPSVTTFYPYLQLSQRGTVADSKTGISFRNTQYDWDLGKIATERQGSSNSFDMVLYSSNTGTYNEGLRIDHTGNIGIGTSTPNAKLDVQGTQGQLFSVTDNLSGDIFSVADISGVPIMNVNSNGTSYFDGNVGIGTTSPDSKLDVKGPSATPADGNQTLSITNSTGGTQLNLGTAENSYGWIEAREGSTLRNLLINPNGGNVGIGTTSPNTPLEVTGGISTTSSDFVIASTGERLLLQTAPSPYSYSKIQATSGGGTMISEVLALQPDGGGVAIGTTSSGTDKLHIVGNTAKLKGSGSGYTAWFITNSGTGNAGTYYDAINGDTAGGDYGFVGQNNSGYMSYDIGTQSPMPYHVFTGGNVGINTTNPAYLLDVRNGTSSNPIARFSAINAHVIIESSTAGPAVLHLKPNATGNKSGQFKVTAGNGYNFRWSNDAAGTGETAYMVLDTSTTGGGDLTVKGDVIAYGAPSDKKYKENIKPIESALDKAMQLQGVTFDWKDSKSILEIKEDIGFIAQDVQEVLPELVRDNGKGNLSLRYQGITPILLEAIKELKAEIDLLKSKPCNCNNCNCSI